MNTLELINNIAFFLLVLASSFSRQYLATLGTIIIIICILWGAYLLIRRKIVGKRDYITVLGYLLLDVVWLIYLFV